MPGLFGTLNIGVSGLTVNQQAIDVTGHNISNASTDGYSRQRVDIQTRSPYGMPSLNSAAGPGLFGTGSEVYSVQRVRDSFLDYQIRDLTTRNGTFKTTNNYLSEVESMFDESSSAGISASITTFFSAIQNYTNASSATPTSIKSIISNAQTMTNQLNNIYTQLTKLNGDVQLGINDDIISVNSMLDKVDSLNQQIITVKQAGKEPNDLEDSRDLLLDQLSEKFGINVDSSPDFDGEDVSVLDKVGNVNPTLVKSVGNDNVNRFSYIDAVVKGADTGSKNGAGEEIYSYEVDYYKLGNKASSDNRIKLNINMTESQAKEIEQARVLMTDKNGIALSSADGKTKLDGTASSYNFSDLSLFKPVGGDINGEQTVQDKINGYIDQMNRVAKTIALAINTVSSGMVNPTQSQLASDGVHSTPSLDELPIFVNSDFTKDASNTTFKPSKYFDDTTNSGKNWEDYITAGNISINPDLLGTNPSLKVRANDDQYGLPSENAVNGSTDQDRAIALAKLQKVAFKIQDVNPDNYTRSDFAKTLVKDTDTGVNTIKSDPDGVTVDDYLKSFVNTLGVDNQSASEGVKGSNNVLSQIKQTREATSGVSLDEEMTNLIQYSHGYQASAKIISTVDQLLDVVVNNLKR
ncbi:flagellar hook protein FlgK [Clostridium acetobutylicum]|nr:flagellar hook protein FlgK [Clostridium acetobutylicum]